MRARRRVDVEHESLPWMIRTRTEVKKECILWDGAMTGDKGSQPRFRDSDGEVKSVHRAVWQALRGPIPEHAVVVRVCGEARCVRPTHLALTTQSRLRQARDSREGVTP